MWAGNGGPPWGFLRGAGRMDCASAWMQGAGCYIMQQPYMCYMQRVSNSPNSQTSGPPEHRTMQLPLQAGAQKHNQPVGPQQLQAFQRASAQPETERDVICLARHEQDCPEKPAAPTFADNVPCAIQPASATPVVPCIKLSWQVRFYLNLSAIPPLLIHPGIHPPSSVLVPDQIAPFTRCQTHQRPWPACSPPSPRCSCPV